ncbi:unnamed protein product [Adineta steineri]|uniref:Uncharacterized protein n=1 Tax=Adineta steineri TaxID=433720 RepID=A0A813MSI4_9BILA|nr:unnamed protein product [Adineta steineri]CAF4082539.1 unnamed protein product [Adineta steineri]
MNLSRYSRQSSSLVYIFNIEDQRTGRSKLTKCKAWWRYCLLPTSIGVIVSAIILAAVLVPVLLTYLQTTTTTTTPTTTTTTTSTTTTTTTTTTI